MKIAYLFACLADGGTEENAISLAKEAKRSGQEVVFIIDERTETALKKIAGFKVVDLSMSSSFNPIKVFKSAIGLKKIIAQEKIDVVHTNMLREHSVAIVSKLIGAHFVLVRAFHRLDNFSWKMRPLMAIYRKYTDGVIAISNTISRKLDENGWRGAWTLIYNGSAKVNAPEHEKALGFIGRLSPEKGILEFVRQNTEILKINKMVIAGDGPDKRAIVELIKKYNLKIDLIGSVIDKADFYKKASVLVLTSSPDTAQFEVMPLVILEAYSCGMPVVAFNLPVLNDLVGSANGVLVDSSDYKVLGKVATETLNEAENYRRTNIKLYETKYSQEIMWHKVYKLYEALLKKAKK